jgi:hypothetical protein
MNEILEAKRGDLEAQRGADSRLNHIIKSKCGASLQITDLLQQQIMQANAGRDLGRAGNTTLEGSAVDSAARQRLVLLEDLMVKQEELLGQVSFELQTVMDWLHRRQVFVQLEARTYSSCLVACDLRHEICKVLQDTSRAELHLNCDPTVHVDTNVLNIVLEEALSNALKHCAAGSLIRIAACLEGAAHEAHLHVEIENQNPEHEPSLTPEECLKVFQTGFKAHCVSTMSDGVGLDSVASACAASGGQAYLTTRELGSAHYTIFHVLLPARRAPNVGDEAGSELNAPLGIVPARRGNSEGDGDANSTESSGCEAGDDAHLLAPAIEPASLAQHPPSLLETVLCPVETEAKKVSPICIAIDDDAFLRMTHTMFFEHALGADMERSGALGVSEAEIAAFCDIIMGRRRVDLSEVEADESRPVDLLFIDHDLGLGPERMGTQLAQQAADAGFEGMVCMVTAATSEEREVILALPCVHMVMEKGLRPHGFAEMLQAHMRCTSK